MNQSHKQPLNLNIGILGMTYTIGVQLFVSFQKIITLPPLSFELATNWLLEVLCTPQKLLPSICQSKNSSFWAQALHLTFLDWQIDSGGSEAFPRVSWWPIPNLVGAASWFFGMTQKFAPLLIQLTSWQICQYPDHRCQHLHQRPRITFLENFIGWDVDTLMQESLIDKKIVERLVWWKEIKQPKKMNRRLSSWRFHQT